MTYRDSLRPLVDHALGTDNPIEQLEDIRAIRRRLDAFETAAVAAARKQGRTWDEVGAALVITRQAAAKRFGQ